MAKGANFYVDEAWKRQFDLFYAALLAIIENELGSASSAAGATAADDAAHALGVHKGELSNLRNGVFEQRSGKTNVKSTTTADKLATALCGNVPSSRLGFDSTGDIDLFWANVEDRRHWLANDPTHGLKAQVAAAFTNPDFKDFLPTPAATGLPEQAPADLSQSTGDDRAPSKLPAGKSTGSWENRISELCYAEAEWRDTNLAPGEGQWLQLKLHFNRSYDRDRVNNSQFNIYLHRVHVQIDLDGGHAGSREPWIEPAEANDHRLTIFQGNDWTKERPSYEIDNPIRNSPLAGRYNWFDFFAVDTTVGEGAVLELSASIGGLSTDLPPMIKEQLDPERRHEYDVPERRLIEGWLRNRLVPKSLLAGAGLFQLTQIKLRKLAT